MANLVHSYPRGWTDRAQEPMFHIYNGINGLREHPSKVFSVKFNVKIHCQVIHPIEANHSMTNVHHMSLNDNPKQFRNEVTNCLPSQYFYIKIFKEFLYI